jgi:PAS domain S-box-containing protein
LWLAVFLPFFWAVPAAARGNLPFILILNSYHYEYAWSDHELAGLLARLHQEYPEIDPHIEYLDTKRFPAPEHRDRVRDHLAGKYRGKKIDLVIALDNAALDLALQNRRELFPNVPLVFAGINDYTPAMLQGQEKVTGVAEVQDVKGTLNLALALQPHAKEVLVIHDYTDTGRAMRQEIEAILPTLKDRVKVSFTPRVTFPEILKQLNSLPPGSLALITAFATDSRGESLGLAESTRLLATSKVPLYAMHKTRLGHGIVGGMLLGGREEGRLAGEIASKILAGEDPARLPVITRSLARPMFDFRQLTRFDIPLASLPTDSIIINRPLPFYEKYKYLTVTLSWTIVFLVLVVASLSLAIIRRRRALAKLQISEAKYRTIVDTAEEGIWSLDQNSRTTFVNDRMAAMLGYTPGEMLGQPASAYILAEDLADQQEKFEQLRQGRIRPYERRFKGKDGREVWAQVSATPLLDASGRFQGGVAMLTDITARKQAEAALSRNFLELEQSKNMLQLIIESIPVRVFWKDRDSRYLGCNTLFAQDAGFSDPQQLLGKDDYAMGWKDQAELYRTDDWQVMDSRRPKLNIVEPQTTPSGDKIWLHTNKVPLQMPNGEVFGVLGTYEDITARKQAEIELKLKERMLDSASDSIFLHDLAGNLVYVNEAAYTSRGYKKEELLGKNVVDLVTPEMARISTRLIDKLQEKGEIIFESLHLRKDGSVIPVEVHARLINGNDGPLVLSVARDITARRQAEEELRQVNETLRATLDAAPVAIFDLDTAGRVKSLWNHAAEQMLGWRRDEVLGRFLPSVPQDSQEEFAAFLAWVHSGKSIMGKDLVRRRKDGSVIEYSLYAAPEYDDEGQVAGNIAVLVDVTERKRVEDAVAAERQRFLSLLEAMPAYVGLMTPDYHVAFANRYFRDQFGEPEGRTCYDYMFGRSEPCENCQAFRVLETGRPEEYEWLGPDGRTYQICDQLVHDTDGSPLILEMGIDITDRKQAEERLRNEKQFSETLLETIPTPVYYEDTSGRYLGCNRAFEEFWGKPREELIGKDVYEMGPQETSDKKAVMDQELFERPGRQRYEWKLRAADGSEKEVIFHKASFLDAMGQVGGLIGVIIDITERKRAEEAFQSLVTHAPMGIYIVQDGKFVMINPGFEAITGYEAQELIGQDCFSTVSPEYRTFVREKAIQRLKGEALPPYEFQFITKRGESGWVMQTITPTQYQGQRAVLGYFMDITPLKKLEAQFLQAQKMEAVGRLSGGVAHDFNNILGVIMGHAELMLMRLNPNDPLSGHVKEIRNAGERAASLTRQLLAFSRKQILQPGVVNLNLMVTDLEKMLHRLIGEDIELFTVLESAQGSVEVDPGQLEQVILNLAVNARDAMPQGGKLTIETHDVNLDEAYCLNHPDVVPGPFLLLAVSDNGMGMDDDTRAHIFDPFFTTKDLGKGTGLGLSTVFGIIKQSGGAIEVYSEPGFGTTFKIYFPRVGELAASPQAEVQVERSLGNETILVVEDDDMLRPLIIDVLKVYGSEALEARDGAEALRICENHPGPIHLMLTDVVMPQMSGRQLAERMAVLRPQMKVLFMSGYTDDAIVHHGILNEDTAYIQKPFAPDDLVKKVREVLEA